MYRKYRGVLSAFIVSSMIALNIFAYPVAAADSEPSGTEVSEEVTEPEPELELEDEDSSRLEVITGVDEEGNVYETDSESGVVENPLSKARSATGKIVNFNTKGNSTTNYKEVETGASGYTCGAYGADAAYLATNGTKIRFMLSGVIGEVESSEVQVVDISNTSSLSYYMVSSGRLIHKITTNVTGTSYASSLDNGPAPSYLKEGTNYYSYDGHYFYTYNTFSEMLSDYNNGTRANSVNSSSPYYNYFQYLPLRSQSGYDGGALNTMINNKVSDTSKMRDLGNTLVNMQNTYGVNALLMSSVAANESAWGGSNICQTKNNLFGLNAVDSSPNESANYYPDVATCVKDFAETYMSKRYLRSGYTYYKGGFLGSKASGINVSYASDPYWGEKAAAIAWSLDRANGSKDGEQHTIGIKDLLSNEHTTLNVRAESNTSSTVLYKTVTQSHYAFLILDGGKTNNTFFRVQSDPVLNASRSAINTESGNYDFKNMYAYASSDYVTIVNKGSGSTDPGGEPENPGGEPENPGGEPENPGGEPENPTWEVADPVKVPADVAGALTASSRIRELGWIDDVGNGEQIGTVGLGYQMEGLKLKINGIEGLGIEYMAHVQTYGWEKEYQADGEEAGVKDESKRIEAVRIRLTGIYAGEYDLYYRAYVNGIGWQDYVGDDEIAGTMEQSKAIEALQIILIKRAADISAQNKDAVTYSTYVQNIGWGGNTAKNGEQSGTIGLAYPITSLKISSGISDVGVEYTTYVPDTGWQEYVSDGTQTQTSSRIEAVKIRLTGEAASGYEVYYRTADQEKGWLGWAKDDAPAGTKGYDGRIEAIQILVVPNGSSAPGSSANAYVEKPMDVIYTSYVNSKGWQDSVKNGATSGTVGSSLAMGGLKISLDSKTDTGDIEYAGHVQQLGWEDWKSSGEVSGTADGTKRLEAVKIRLTGNLEKQWDIYYRTHVQQLGWLGWAMNGAQSGSAGYSYRVEAIEICLVRKGGDAPGSTEGSFKMKAADVVYSAHVQRSGWQPYVKNGETAGTQQQSLRMEALKIYLANQILEGDIEYSAHVQNFSWQDFVRNDAVSGTEGLSKRVEALRIRLTGELAEACDVYYRVHMQTYGWTGWAMNGNPAGSVGLSKRVEAVEIKIVTKGDPAPGSSDNAFYQ